MAWTAKFSGYNAADNKVNIEFTDGKRTESASFTPPGNLAAPEDAVAWAKGAVADIIARLVSRDSLTGVAADTDVTPEPVKPPDPNEVKRASFLALVDSANTLKDKIAALTGLKEDATEAQTAYDDIIVQIKTALGEEPDLYDDLLGRLK